MNRAQAEALQARIVTAIGVTVGLVCVAGVAWAVYLFVTAG